MVRLARLHARGPKAQYAEANPSLRSVMERWAGAPDQPLACVQVTETRR